MRSPHVRLRAAAAAVLALLAVGSWATVARARSRATRAGHRPRLGPRTGIVVVQVNGLLDPSNAALIKKSLRDAATLDALAARVPARRIGRGRRRHGLARAGGSRLAGARSRCGSARRAAKRAARARCSRSAASYVSVAPGAHIGPVVPVDFDEPDARSGATATATVASSTRSRPRARRRVVDPSPVGQDRARRQAHRRDRADALPVHRRARTARCCTPPPATCACRRRRSSASARTGRCRPTRS